MIKMGDKNPINDSIVVMFTREELRIVHQALNKVCDDVDFSEAEFSTCMEARCAEVQALLSCLGGLYDDLDTAGSEKEMCFD